jgi:glycosyltransferase involved in cell wall biosynthesis
MRPLISICIATYNRADILDYCLENLAPLKDCGKSVEIVVSDNGSTDHTQSVIEAHRRRNPSIRPIGFPENRGPAANWLNTVSHGEGEIIVYMADDDSLIVDNLLHHVETMEQDPELVAIYTDWIAWDDRAGSEIHRYFTNLNETVSFDKTPLQLIDFMLKRFPIPEIGLYRREALLQARRFNARSLPFYMRMYQLSRLGRIAFDPLPFYREHRVLKEPLRRTHWANIDMNYYMVGEELRLSLEEIVLMAVQDAGGTHLPQEQSAFVWQSIERILHSRIRLEADRAGAHKNWIAGVELRRRYVLWHGPGSDEETRQDVLRLVLPAALQAVQLTFTGLSTATGISLRGFETGQIVGFFATHYPDTLILPPNADSATSLVLHRDEQTLSQDTAAGDPAKVMVLERLLDLYRITRSKIDLKGF